MRHKLCQTGVNLQSLTHRGTINTKRLDEILIKFRSRMGCNKLEGFNKVPLYPRG